MKVLVIATIFPSSARPQVGTFVHARLEALAARGHDLRVLSPVPWAPRWLRIGRWGAYAATPAEETWGRACPTGRGVSGRSRGVDMGCRFGW